MFGLPTIILCTFLSVSTAATCPPSPEVLLLGRETHALRVQVETLQREGTLLQRVAQARRRR